MDWLSRARRVALDPPAGNAVSDLRAGFTPAEVARRRGLPPAAAEGVLSFYDLVEERPRVCDGTACHFQGGQAVAGRLGGRVPGGPGEVRCLGRCWEGPSVWWGERVWSGGDRVALVRWAESGSAGPPPEPEAPLAPRRSLVTPPVVLRHVLGGVRVDPFLDYELPGGDEILDRVLRSGLRGRGGAAFPTGRKWAAARAAPGPVRYVVANGDEGDPGSFVDRVLLEEAPHSVLAGMVACARAVGATHGFVYVRAEYPRARDAVARALSEARQAGVLGEGLGIEVVSGAGSYVCGEENALLRSIEGLRGEPTPKPPYPAERGLFGRPTIVQNVETLSVVPALVRGEASPGTKAVCLSGAIARPGIVEIPLGMPVRRVLEEGGGGPAPGRRWKMAVIGGPLGRVLPESAWDTPLDFDALPGMGHGGMVVLDDGVSARDVARHFFRFARLESCGTCTPCRVGTAHLEDRGSTADLVRLLDTLEMGSLCGFGQGVPRPIRDLLAAWPGELFPC